MVLPPPPPDPPQSAPAWRRLSAALSLAKTQVLILLLAEQPVSWRALLVFLQPFAHVRVVLNASMLSDSPPEALYLLPWKRADAIPLNLLRPMLKGRRVLMWARPEEMEEMRQQAPDFFDWISHIIHLPAVRVPRISVALRASERLRWEGKDLEKYVEGPVLSVVPNLFYGALHTQLSQEGIKQITGLGSLWALARLRMALNDGGRGPIVLENPQVATPDFPCVHAKIADLNDASMRLMQAGYSDAPRLVALLDREPEAMDLAVLLAAQKEAVLAVSEDMTVEDSGRALAVLVHQHALLHVCGAPCLRAGCWQAAVVVEPVYMQRVAAIMENMRAGQCFEAIQAAQCLGFFDVAEVWAQRLLVEEEGRVRGLNAIGQAQLSQGKYAEALVNYRHVLEIQQKTLSDMHIEMARTLYGIGQVLYGQGRYAEALDHYQCALSIREKTLGDAHPSTGILLNAIGQVLHRQGHNPEALAYYQRSLSIMEKTLGDAHPETAMTLLGIGLVLYDQGHYAEAMAYYQRSLSIMEQTLGDAHPDTAITLYAMAQMLAHQGHNVEALAYYQRSLSIIEQTLGDTHPSTALTRFDLGRCLRDLGNLNGLQQMQAATRQMEGLLGPEHPNVKAMHAWLQ